MAKPRVFVSSTFYDLKHVRASLEIFIESLGYEAVLFEKGDIAFHPDIALDTSCYREAETADIFVLIIGGRYGSQVSESDIKIRPDFFDQYKSITETEFETAQSADVPTYIMIDKAVRAEYQTYLRNKGNSGISYAHVDSINVFRLIENIFTRNKNNPVYEFERASDIESWLRDQWSGLFRELLRVRSQQRQLSALNAQVKELHYINDTLKNYLEVVLGKVAPEASGDLIKAEQQKIDKNKQEQEIQLNRMYIHLVKQHGISLDRFRDFIENSSSAEDAYQRFADLTGKSIGMNLLERHNAAKEDFNEIRKIFGFPEIEFKKSPDIAGAASKRPAKKDRQGN